MISRSSGIVWSRPNTIKTRSRTGPTRTRSRTDPGNTWSRTDPTSNLSTKYWENLDRFNFLGLHILTQLDPLNCRNRQSYVLCRFNVVIKQLVLSVAWKSIYKVNWACFLTELMCFMLIWFECSSRPRQHWSHSL